MKVLFVINKITNTSIPLELAEKINGLKNVELLVLSFYNSPFEVSKLRNELGLEVQIKGLGITSIFSLKKLWDLNKIIKEEKPDIIHTHHTLSGAVSRIIGGLKKNVKVIHTVHADHRSYSLYQNILTGMTLPFCDLIIFNSLNTKNSLFKWQDKLVKKIDREVIYNGVNIKQLSAAIQNVNVDLFKDYNIDDDTFLIGTVGRLVRAKDQKTLIKGFARASASIRNSRLIIVGEGPERKKLEDLADALQIRSKVIFTGHVNRSEVYNLLSRMNLFVITSIYEGFCNALVEGMIAKKAIITTNINPLPEVVGDNNALFIEKSNDVELSNKIIRLYNYPEFGEKLASSAQSYALNNYSLNRCATRHLSLYQYIL